MIILGALMLDSIEYHSGPLLSIRRREIERPFIRSFNGRFSSPVMNQHQTTDIILAWILMSNVRRNTVITQLTG